MKLPQPWRFRGVVLVLACHAPLAIALEIPVGSWRVAFEGKLEGRYVHRIESSSPHEDPEGKLRLRIGSDLASWLHFQTAFTGVAGGLPRDPRGSGVFNLDDTLQDISPSFEADEAYFDLYLPSLDTRIGLQKFAWGKLDGIQPNDFLNPEKFYDPILEDENDRKVGVPALSSTFYLPPLPGEWWPTNLAFTGAWTPIVVPHHFPDEDERWYPPIARVPRQSQANGFTVENESRILNGEIPSRDLSNGGGAARFSGLFHGADFAFYYYDGFDPFPAFDVDARGFVRLNPLNPQGFDVRSEIDIFPVFDRIRAAGLDLAYNFLGATFRAEGAWVQGRLYPRSIGEVVASQEVGDVDPVLLATGQEQEVPVTLAPVNVERDGVEWGAGGDYLREETFFLVQLNQTTVLDNDTDLLISDFETRLASTVRRSFLDEKLEAEVIGYYGIQGVFGLAHPRVTYNLTDDLDVRVGYVLIEGHESSIIGQYKHNDQVYTRLRLSF